MNAIIPSINYHLTKSCNMKCKFCFATFNDLGVVKHNLENSKKIISEIDTNNITVLQNDHWKEGLGKSIAFGMNHINQSNLEIDHVLIVLADQPLIDVHYLKLLLCY